MSRTRKYYYKNLIYNNKLMLWFITIICISNIIRANGFIIQDTFNVLLKDDADYKVTLIITDDDYEMIEQKELKEFKIENENEKFKKLNEMARKANSRVSTIRPKYVKQPFEMLPIIVLNGQSNTVMTTYIGPLQPTTVSTNNRRAIKEENETVYDYDSLLNDYYDEANNESRSQNAYHIRKSVNSIKDYGAISSLKNIFTLTRGIANCSEVNGIGIQAVKCLLEDYDGQRQSMRELIARLWRIFKMWFLVYLGVAIPLWCTRGWCCCCLCCKFFKPRQTIEEAKKYMADYPPGIFKNKNEEIRYEPSEQEKQCYEELEYFIKTL